MFGDPFADEFTGRTAALSTLMPGHILEGWEGWHVNFCSGEPRRRPQAPIATGANQRWLACDVHPNFSIQPADLRLRGTWLAESCALRSLQGA